MSIETMNSRQRVIKTLNHEPTDRMPIDLGVHFSTSISAYAYQNLRAYLGMSTDHIEMVDCVQGLARVDQDIIDRFHIDTILLNPSWQRTRRWQPRGNYDFIVPEQFLPKLLADGSYEVRYQDEKMIMPQDGYFFDGCWPDYYGLLEEDKIDYFAKRAEFIYKETDKFTMLMGFSAYFEGLDFACDMLTDPTRCIEANEAVLKREIERFNKVNKRMGKYINAIEVNSDLGTQDDLMCTPDSYEEICYPYLKRFCQHVHENSDIKIFMHSCGSIIKALPLIVSAGVDAINPVQISARGMDPAMLKKEFGDKITFWGGGCNTQSILWAKKPQEVAEHTKQMIDIFKPGGGFVFNQVHNIMGNVPPENIVAMLDTAYENAF